MTRARNPARRPIALGLLLIAVGTVPLQAQDDWCAERYGDRERHCEVREYTLRASGSLRVDATPNGGIEVMAWNRDEVQVIARVTARADNMGAARAIADEITISTSGTIAAEGPRVDRGEGWSVSYRIRVPASYDLDLESLNGGIGVEGVAGELALATTNGGIHLSEVGGDVRARTTNGGLHVELSGDRWRGSGLDAETTNGGVVLTLPEDYSARLEMGTTHGGFDMDIPMTVSGRISGRRITTDIGGGGPPVRVITTNGGVQVRRAS